MAQDSLMGVILERRWDIPLEIGVCIEHTLKEPAGGFESPELLITNQFNYLMFFPFYME